MMYQYLMLLCCTFVAVSLTDSKLRLDPCPCPCPERVNIKMAIYNRLQVPGFRYDITLLNQTKQSLIRHMEHAADIDKHFRFGAEYAPVLGYYVSSINDVAGDLAVKTYWEPFANGKFLPVGVSNFIPQNGDFIEFNFTRDAAN